MATDFSKLKLISQHTKLLGHGYLRNLNKNDKPIPKEIIFICILYSYEFEQFKEHSDDFVLSTTDAKTTTINNSATLITETGHGGWRSVYGEYNIDCTQNVNRIFEWIFKIKAKQASIEYVQIDQITEYLKDIVLVH